MTAPLVPADTDLRDFAFMPLDVVRLIDSDLTAIASGDEFKAAILLWCKAWHQVPASSLPNDDRMLAHLSGYGKDIKAFQKVKEVALRGFVLCDDGRLYHPVIAEKAIEAAEAKTARAVAKEGELSRKQRERAERAELFSQLRAAGIAPKWNVTMTELRKLVADLSRPVTVTGHAPVTPPVTRTVTAKTGTGTGTGTGKVEDDGKIARATATNQELFKRVEDTLRAIKELDGHPVAINPVIAPIFRLVVDQGLDLDTQIVPSIRRQALTAKRPLKLWTYFTDGILADAATPPAGATANGQPPRRRNSASQDIADAFDRVKAHVAGRDPGP